MTVREFHRARMQASFTQTITDETIRAKTGKTWREWDAILDGWQRTHQDSAATARDLRHEYAISTWWSHTITARYCWSHGLLD
jgi:hypothetical protein